MQLVLGRYRAASANFTCGVPHGNFKASHFYFGLLMNSSAGGSDFLTQACSLNHLRTS